MANTQTSQATSQEIELCVVVPTFNEADNVEPLISLIESALLGIGWELIFVDDDSTDLTSERVRTIARKDRRIRCIHRIGRRGLSTACIEGMLSTPAIYLAVMDGDLQHDETRLPLMLALLKSSSADLVVGSRYAAGGGLGSWSETRATMSRGATWLSRLALRHDISDPMSGFFMLRRDVLEGSVRSLSGIGFKILLDIVASSSSKLRVAEVPYTFRSRAAGESKLDSAVLWEFGMLLVDKTIGRYVPVRLLSFLLIGGLGVLVHLMVLTPLLRYWDMPFTLSQSAATVVAMVFNFSMNNVLTYRDRRLKGWLWLKGLASFAIACSVGAFANVGISAYLFKSHTQWILSALSGIALGAIWNYAITQIYTWGKRN